MTASGRVFSASVILLSSFFLRELLHFASGRLLSFLAVKKITYEQERLFRETCRPLSFVPIVAGAYLALNVAHVPAHMAAYTRGALRILFIFNAVWLLYSSVDPAILMLKRQDGRSNAVVLSWVSRIAKFMIALTGCLLCLQRMDVHLGTLIASVGVVGLPFALGAQDMFKNIVSGMAIISEKRFGIGDFIRTENGGYPIEGIVEDIGFRSTLIRKFDKAPLYVPNNTLADAAVMNFSSRLYRRIDWNIQLEYRTSAAQLRYIRQEIEDYMTASPDFVNPPEATLQVRLNQFGQSSIDIAMICFTNTNVFTEFMEIKERLLLKVKEVVEESGAAFALPASSLYVEKIDRKPSVRELSPKLGKKLRPESGKDGQEKLNAELAFASKESI
jgi:MscS family membrane protein